MGDINDDNDTLSMWDHLYKFCDLTIKIHEDFDAGLGGTLFDGSLLLCNYMEHLFNTDNDYFKGKTIVELGAGCGVPGLLAGAVGACAVSLTDIEQTVELLEENVENNQHLFDTSSSNVQANVLDWTSAANVETAQAWPKTVDSAGYDFILAADTVYDIKCVDPFIDTMRALCNGGKTTVMFAHPSPRVPAASKVFWEKMNDQENSYFDVKKIPFREYAPPGEKGDHFTAPTNGIFLFTLKNADQ